MMEFYNVFLFSTQKQCSTWAFLCYLDPYLKYVPIITLCLGCLAFYLAFNTYLRKSSVKVRANFTFKKEGSQYRKHYIDSYTIENEKDKSIVIYASYLRIGYDLYILLEDFRKGKDENQLILKAYEVHHRIYSNIHWYSSDTEKYELDELLENSKVKKTIVLSTSHGKCTAKTKIKIWLPYSSFFNYKFIKGREGFLIQNYAKWQQLDFISLKKKDISNNRLTFAYKEVVRLILKMIMKMKDQLWSKKNSK